MCFSFCFLSGAVPLLKPHPLTGWSPVATTSCSTSLCVLRARARTQNTQTYIKGLFAAQPQHVLEYCPHCPGNGLVSFSVFKRSILRIADRIGPNVGHRSR